MKIALLLARLEDLARTTHAGNEHRSTSISVETLPKKFEVQLPGVAKVLSIEPDLLEKHSAAVARNRILKHAIP